MPVSGSHHGGSQQFTQGFAAIVTGDNVSLRRAGGWMVSAKNDAAIRQGGAQLIGAGNNVKIHKGGGFVIGAGNKVKVKKGGALVVGAKTVRLSKAFVGVAIGRNIDIRESRVVLGSAGSVMVGVAVGLLIGMGFRRR